MGAGPLQAHPARRGAMPRHAHPQRPARSAAWCTPRCRRWLIGRGAEAEAAPRGRCRPPPWSAAGQSPPHDRTAPTGRGEAVADGPRRRLMTLLSEEQQKQQQDTAAGCTGWPPASWHYLQWVFPTSTACCSTNRQLCCTLNVGLWTRGYELRQCTWELQRVQAMA